MAIYLEALCHVAAEKKNYWRYLDAHCKLWFILDKLGQI